MKIVYVGDNRCRGNYGCRGTSTALSQLISQNHEIVGRISGEFTNFNTDYQYVVKGKSEESYKRLSHLKGWKYIRKGLYYFHRFKGKGGKYYLGKYDFASYNFDEAIENLIAAIPANPYLKEFDLRQYDFDALVVNGEGSFIFATPAWRESMVEAMEMHWAKKMGKKVFYMNGMLSDDPHSAHNEQAINVMKPLFESCDEFCVREYESLDYLHKYYPTVNAKVFPDALFTWFDLVNDGHVIDNGKYYIPHVAECDEAYYEFDFTKPYICISGSSSILGVCNGNIEVAISSYKKLVEKCKESFRQNIFLVQVCEGDDFLNEVAKRTGTPIISLETPLVAAAKILSRSDIYISGRYHPSIMAALGGTPTVYMSSNSHKTRSIQQLLEYENAIEHPVIPNEVEIDEIISHAKQYLTYENSLREKLKNRAELLSNQAKGMIDVIK